MPRITLGLTAVCALLLSIAPGRAEVIFYTDRAAFHAASATVRIEGFEDFASAGANLSSFERNGILVEPIGGATNVHVAPPSNAAFTAARISNVMTASGIEIFRVSFAMPQRAVGFDTYLNDKAATVEAFGFDGERLARRVHGHAATEIGFLGMVATEPIHSVTWSADPTSDLTKNTGIDNLRAAGTARVSVDSAGRAGNSLDSTVSPLSADGRFVAFASNSSNLVAGDGNGRVDVFLHDTVDGTTRMVSVSDGGLAGNANSGRPSLSADGRFVAFASGASNLVPGDGNDSFDVFLRDTVELATTRVSEGIGGDEADGVSVGASISADGRFVAFESSVPNLVAGDGNGVADIFLRDTVDGTTTIASVGGGGALNAFSLNAAVSADGRFVAFESEASNVVAGDDNGLGDVFRRDMATGTTALASVRAGGGGANGASGSPALSADGRVVAFHSGASDLVSGDGNDAHDIFVRDVETGTTTLISVAHGGGAADGPSIWPALSADGRLVAFHSVAGNLVAGDGNGTGDIFVRDRPSTATALVSLTSTGAQSSFALRVPRLSADGRFVAFQARALVEGGSAVHDAIYLRVIDQDGDGVLDAFDNCFVVHNADQADFDGDGVGNECDPDIDGDGMSNAWEDLHGLIATDPADAEDDNDNDGLSNLGEFLAGRDPNLNEPAAAMPVLYLLLGD